VLLKLLIQGIGQQCNDAITVLKNAPTAYLNYITTTSPYNTQYITECNVPVILPWVQSGLSIVEVKELNDTLPIETNLPMPNFRSCPLKSAIKISQRLTLLPNTLDQQF
jgi:hypothetical protein